MSIHGRCFIQRMSSHYWCLMGFHSDFMGFDSDFSWDFRVIEWDLVGGDWNMTFMTFHSVGNGIIIPIDEL